MSRVMAVVSWRHVAQSAAPRASDLPLILSLFYPSMFDFPRKHQKREFTKLCRPSQVSISKDQKGDGVVLEKEI